MFFLLAVAAVAAGSPEATVPDERAQDLRHAETYYALGLLDPDSATAARGMSWAESAFALSQLRRQRQPRGRSNEARPTSGGRRGKVEFGLSLDAVLQAEAVLGNEHRLRVRFDGQRRHRRGYRCGRTSSRPRGRGGKGRRTRSPCFLSYCRGQAIFNPRPTARRTRHRHETNRPDHGSPSRSIRQPPRGMPDNWRAAWPRAWPTTPSLCRTRCLN